MQSKRLPWFKFYPRDWRADPDTRLLSLPAKGLLLELMCLAHDGDPYGHITSKGRALNAHDLSKVVACNYQTLGKALAELEHSGCVTTPNGCAMCVPRMVRDYAKRVAAQEHGSEGWKKSAAKRVEGSPKGSLDLEKEVEKEVEVEVEVEAEVETTQTLATKITAVYDNWNNIAKQHDLPQARGQTPKRSTAIKARIKDNGWASDYIVALGAIPVNAFLLGKNDRGWRANIDWFLKPDSVDKILEGAYMNEKKGPAPRPGVFDGGGLGKGWRTHE